MTKLLIISLLLFIAGGVLLTFIRKENALKDDAYQNGLHTQAIIKKKSDTKRGSKKYVLGVKHYYFSVQVQTGDVDVSDRVKVSKTQYQSYNINDTLSGYYYDGRFFPSFLYANREMKQSSEEH